MVKEEKSLINIDDPKSIQEFLQSPTLKIAEALTGIFSSDFNWKFFVAKLVQASVKGKLFTQLGREIRDLVKKGEIKEDYYATNKNQATLLELLQFIDSDAPDFEKFRALKSIFLYSVLIGATEQDEICAYELMRLCKQLSSGEILVLKTFYDFSKGKNPPKIILEAKGYNYQNWVHFVSIEQGHNLAELVRNNADRLLEFNILNRDLLTEASKSFPSPITTLGFKLCEFITRYP